MTRTRTSLRPWHSSTDHQAIFRKLQGDQSNVDLCQYATESGCKKGFNPMNWLIKEKTKKRLKDKCSELEFPNFDRLDAENAQF